MRTTALWPANENTIGDAAEFLKAGCLVAFPTETVYGLGANALDSKAVSRIFAAKGRPATNPVIVHVDRDYSDLVSETPPIARTLTDCFWPGPLTLVMKRSEKVPDVVTAGGPTVAIRSPAHPVARQLIQACGFPLAAPSANRSTCLSPTRAEHVLRSLGGRIHAILDGGPCVAGIESTVVDVTTDPPTLLRPGAASIAELEAVIGPMARIAGEKGVARSPGQLAKHYSPRTPVGFSRDAEEVRRLLTNGDRVGWLMFGAEETPSEIFVEMPANPQAYAACLYDVLHKLDAAGLDRIVVSLPPEDDDWLAIHDRLSRMN